jgi:hypothetical protein
MSYKFVEGSSYVKALLSAPTDRPFVPPVQMKPYVAPKSSPKSSPKQETHNLHEDKEKKNNGGKDDFFDEHHGGKQWMTKDDAEKWKERKKMQEENKHVKRPYDQKKQKLNFPRAEEEEVKNIREFILSKLPPNLNDYVKELNTELEKTYHKRNVEIKDKIVKVQSDEDDKIKKKAKEELSKKKKDG